MRFQRPQRCFRIAEDKGRAVLKQALKDPDGLTLSLRPPQTQGQVRYRTPAGIDRLWLNGGIWLSLEGC